MRQKEHIYKYKYIYEISLNERPRLWGGLSAGGVLRKKKKEEEEEEEEGEERRENEKGPKILKGNDQVSVIWKKKGEW